MSSGVATAPEENPVARFLRLIRFSHTVFALPFALGALVVAAKGRPSARTLGLVLICMVAARSAAMLFNRWCDWTLDQRNPRTSARHTLLSRSTILVALVVSSAIFMMAAVAINRLTGWLAPVALLVVFFYSVTKRFTDATHFFLGMALAIAPIGAWIAQTGRVELAPLLLAIGVIGWVAGFDLIYATQDYEFDRRERLHSLVVRLGVRRSLQLAQWLHAMMLASLIGFGMAAGLGKIYFLTLPLVIGALIYEHRSAARLDLTAINRAFFQSNAFVSVVFLAAVCLDRLR
jgi:4-hydroxybenzoate polyprenyltransferase